MHFSWIICWLEDNQIELVTGEILMVDEKMLVEPPHIPDAMDLVPFNVLFAHLFSTSTPSPAKATSMARQENEKTPLANFHNELRLALTSYYEGIVKLEGTSGVSQKLAYKNPIKRITDASLNIPAPPPPAANNAEVYTSI
uniref:Uncharacterized protein n=1 Tax=Cryptomonas curvata TaxID=233186 RepID=A0A7S0M9I6_9CRYP|mmetsp:Transcript_28224/g.58924  ORF Transcript_28224/g.58924 Transcript_28224/m.58924 type:complete len:141 (+) Transcript_28224:25-447(+)|eukprot:CAMPEP_0172172030 /NCGR_PEP_ID=MMETSP1050-20130122/12218_1 /TAXON_ID=233186 /ORGANISM="Cryptomonas curvata, Strain CCAP979/52" /LENGTH=140 /DNA_ID=CAMNT_0012843521 /DNA_START=303 /DNA_END=725 /DNA_ORIENTATION=-